MIILYSKLEGNCILLHSEKPAPNIDRYAPDILRLTTFHLKAR